jgi:hypothetical protein
VAKRQKIVREVKVRSQPVSRLTPSHARLALLETPNMDCLPALEIKLPDDPRVDKPFENPINGIRAGMQNVERLAIGNFRNEKDEILKLEMMT